MINFKKVYNQKKYVILYFTFYYLILLRIGFPLPYGDDLFFLGTSLNYEMTGEYLNPGVEDFCLKFGDIKKPYWFVPFHMQMMGWWLKITGITDLTVRLYLILCIFITTFFIWLIARQKKSDTILVLLFLPIIVSFGYTWSFRPECTAIPLFTIGVYYLQRNRNLSSKWCGISSLGLCTLSSQILIIPSALIIVSDYLENKNYIKINNYVILCIFGGLQTLIIGFYIINFEIFEFLEMFMNHIKFMSMTTLQNVNLFMFITCKLGNGIFLKLPSYIFLILSLILYLKKKKSNYYSAYSYLISLILMILIYAKSELTILFLTTFYTLILIFINKSYKNLFISLITFFICMRSASVFLLNVYINKIETANDFVTLDENITYVIDEYTIREPLNWKLPKKWKMIPGYSCSDHQITEKPKHENWIVSKKNLAYYYPNLFSHKKFLIWGKEFNNISPNLWRYEVIK